VLKVKEVEMSLDARLSGSIENAGVILPDFVSEERFHGTLKQGIRS
jgi:hypothetical protein